MMGLNSRFGKRSGSPPRKSLLPYQSAIMKSLYQLEPSHEINQSNLQTLERQSSSSVPDDWQPLDDELVQLIWNSEDSERSKRQDEISFASNQ